MPAVDSALRAGQGSALADLRTYAVPQADGTYRLFGQKMFISGGDQSMTENIVHRVLARIKDAPPGVKGISLFLCPKVLVSDDGSLGARMAVGLCAAAVGYQGYHYSLASRRTRAAASVALRWASRCASLRSSPWRLLLAFCAERIFCRAASR